MRTRTTCQPAVNLAQVLGQIVRQMNLRRFLGGEEDMMQGRSDTESQDSLSRRGLPEGVDEKGDGLSFVQLHRAVVFGEIRPRLPFGVEAGIAAAPRDPIEEKPHAAR